MLLALGYGRKEAKNKEEKVKSKLCGGHSNCYWVEVRKIAEEMERSKEKQAIGQERVRMTYQQEIWMENNSARRKNQC
jgi:hypothetical protein